MLRGFGVQKIKVSKPKSVGKILSLFLILTCIVVALFGSDALTLAVFIATLAVGADSDILVEIAEKYPEVVKMVKREGHEVAFHGWAHEPSWKLTPERFREEAKAFKRLHPDCIGFRAPSFSLNNKTKWALKILCEESFKYDASIFPTWTPLYGMYKAPTYPYHPSLTNITKKDEDCSIIEFPLAVYKLFGLKVPAAGGFWLRLWNLDMIKRGIKKFSNEEKTLNPMLKWQHLLTRSR